MGEMIEFNTEKYLTLMSKEVEEQSICTDTYLLCSSNNYK
jgi:hypothetical protein